MILPGQDRYHLSIDSSSQIRTDGFLIPFALQSHRPGRNAHDFGHISHWIGILRNLRPAMIKRKDLADRIRRLFTSGLIHLRSGITRNHRGKIAIGSIDQRIVKERALDALFIVFHPSCLLPYDALTSAV